MPGSSVSFLFQFVLGRSTLKIESFLRNWDPRAKKYKWPRIFCQLANIFVKADSPVYIISDKKQEAPKSNILFRYIYESKYKIRTVWKPRLKVRVVELLAAVDQREVISLRILIILTIYMLLSVILIILISILIILLITQYTVTIHNYFTNGSKELVG